MRNRRMRAVPAALLAVALAALGLASTAQAELEGEFEKFQYCPYENTEVKKCQYAVTEGGEVKLGSKTVPIVNDVVLQGGFGKPNKETKISEFFAPTGGKKILQEVSQNVPGGLLGVVPENKQNWLIKRLIKFFFENSLTGLGSTLQLAGSAEDVEISESNLSRKENLALKLPVKIHLENPFLGSKCYVGSNSSPIVWNLTTGKTADEKLEGSAGKIEFLEGGLILRLNENKLVENAWSAPKATGCGGILAFLVNPIVNSSAGLPAASGNVAILENTIDIATAAAVKYVAENGLPE